MYYTELGKSYEKYNLLQYIKITLETDKRRQKQINTITMYQYQGYVTKVS